MTEETLFQEALSKSESERAAFLEKACAGQPELRTAVDSLLVAHEPSPNPLDQTVDSEPGAAAPDATSEFTPGPDAGKHRPADGTADYRHDAGPGFVVAERYTLQDRLGEGGMGEVWTARQSEPVKRKVAVKLIKAGMDSRSVVQRFEQERQALAMMDHPNIAKVLDGGLTSDRRPFFVMELVNGLPLTKFCDEMKLGVKERLELFVPICHAVQHAHQKGIVHRDLKPSNILVTTVDGKPVPKVIDFGIAKAMAGKLTEESMSTQFGAVVGTLEYMSPEQAGLTGEDVDTRADIYSLGVVLYELLTGLRPIDSKRLKRAALDEMMRVIREEEPSKPSTRLSTDASLPSMAALRQTEPHRLMALLRGELDWVVMKCLEKVRERRYETANGLARDIQRYLADEVVEARPPSTSYRLRKYLRRNRGAVLAASLVLLTVLGGLGAVVAVQRSANGRLADANQRIAEQRDEAERQRELAAAAKTTAEENERTAQKQAMLALTSMQLIVTEIDGKLAAHPGTAPLRIGLLKTLEKKWDELDLAMAGGISGEAVPTLMAVRGRIAAAWITLDKLAEADAQYQKLFEQAERRLVLKDRSDSSRYNLATICHGWAPIKARLSGNPADANALRVRAADLLREIGRDPRPQTGSPQAYMISDVLQGVLVASASAWIKEEGDREKAEAAYAEVGRICETVLREAEAKAKWFTDLKPELQLAVKRYFLQNLEISRSGRANNLCALGKIDEAEAIYRGVIERSRAAQAKAPDDRNARDQLAMQLQNYGQQMLRVGRTEVAAKLQAESLEHAEKYFNADPTNAQMKRNYANILYYLGVVRDAQGRKEEARALFNRSRALRQELHAVSQDTANKVNLMLVESQLGNSDAAKALIDQLSAIKSRDPDLRLDIARAWALLGRRADGAARDGFRKAALVALNMCLADGQKDRFTIASQPDLATLRNDAEFRAVLARLASAGAPKQGP